jgi:two-component system, NarL family, response regulator NreC
VVIDRYETLSDREREVFQLIAEGKTNKDIAGLLFISPSTVETHRAHIMESRLTWDRRDRTPRRLRTRLAREERLMQRWARATRPF